MTAGVYGLVAAIVELDDFGLYLSSPAANGGPDQRAWVPPSCARALADEGAVGRRDGGDVPGRRRILLHGIPPLYHTFERLADGLAELPAVGDTLRLLTLIALDATAGIIAGALVLGIVTSVRRLLRPRAGSG